MIAILCTDGQMNFGDVTKECVEGKWIPLLIYKQKKEETIYLPVFSIETTAKDFIKRNLPKPWIHGGVYLTDDDLKEIDNRGWKLDHITFPRKILNNPDFELGFEIHEFQSETDYKVGRI
jgi:hypothetical protein